MISLKIRRATEKDVDAISRLDNAGEFEERMIREYLCSIDKSRREKTVILLAIDGENAMGKAEVVIGKRGDTGKLGYLRKIVVIPEQRGKGIATALAEKAFEICREEGATTLDLHVTEDNKGAISLYQKLGFKTRHKELHMRKEITE